MVVPSISYSNGTPTNCGITGSASSPTLVSCTQNGACSNSSDQSNCWTINPSGGGGTNPCTGDAFDQSTGAAALNTYKNNYNSASPAGSNYSDLFTSCYYRQQLTAVQPVQFNCDPTTVTRGCSGSPPIIQTNSLTTTGGFTACSNNNPVTGGIPDTNRCQNNTGSLSTCTGFPYSCSTNDGTNNLCVPS